ncbi:MAG: hypothetical protein ACQETL_18975 [Bacteroidota bacterium]
MEEIIKMSNSFEETLKDSNLHNISTGFAETITDSLLEDGFMKEIPIVNTIVGLSKSAIRITDLLFLKKVISFLSEQEFISQKDRIEMIDKIDSSKKYRMKVGEKLLYIIDKCDDYENSQYISMLFAGFIKGEIDYPDFLRASKIIERIYIGDLKKFIENDRTELNPTELVEYEGTGLYDIYTDEITLNYDDDWQHANNYRVHGGEPIGIITEIGKKIRSVLKDKE